MTLGHIMGLPIEETASQLLPAGAALVTAVAVSGRIFFGRLRRRLPGRSLR